KVIEIQNLGIGATVLISFKGHADCNVAIGTSNSINSALLVKEGATTLLNQSFVVNKSLNGDLELNTSEPSWNQSSNYSKTVTRIYELKNNSTSVFTGVINFSDVVGSALTVQATTIE